MTVFLPVCISFILTSFLIYFFRKPSVKLGFVDKPGGRKTHKNPVPPIGGLVLVPVAVLTALGFGYGFEDNLAFMMALTLLLFTGAVDDRTHIPAILRFGIQILAAFLVVVPGGAYLQDLGNMFGFGEFNLGYFALPFFIFCAVLLINAMNMIDGLDGLSGGIGLVILTATAILTGEEFNHNILLFSFLAALAGFLVFNMRHPFNEKASVFIGDSGSLAIGMTLCWICINAAKPEFETDAAIKPMAIAWVLAFPVMDAFALFTKRLSEKRHPFDADRLHMHYILKDAGLSVSMTVSIILFINVVYGFIGWTLHCFDMPVWPYTYVWLALLACHTAIIFKADTVQGLLKKRLA